MRALGAEVEGSQSPLFLEVPATGASMPMLAGSAILDGFGELMRQVSLQFVPTAILSRQIAGIRGESLIINLPGKPSAIADCLDAVFPAVPYCIDLIDGPYLETDDTVVRAFRPKTKPDTN